MATSEFCLSDYLNARLIRLGIELSEVELTAIGIKYLAGFDLSERINGVNIDAADKACLYPVRDILLQPNIQEGGYSVQYDKPSIEKWYNAELSRLGLQNSIELSLAPKVRDASNRW